MILECIRAETPRRRRGIGTKCGCMFSVSHAVDGLVGEIILNHDLFIFSLVYLSLFCFTLFYFPDDFLLARVVLFYSFYLPFIIFLFSFDFNLRLF